MNPFKSRINLDLISIKSDSEKGFDEVLKKLRSNSKNALSLDEISEEVEKVRSKRYGKR